MVLSRIWSAFIIIAIAVASIKYISSENYSQIFNDMVVGKGGDTIHISQKPLAQFSPEIQKSLSTNPDFEDNHIHYKMDSLQNVKTYRISQTDGVIGTSETAVNICLKLIGIMALFYGLYEHCRKSWWHQFPQSNDSAILLKIISRDSKKPSIFWTYDVEFQRESFRFR